MDGDHSFTANLILLQASRLSLSEWPFSSSTLVAVVVRSSFYPRASCVISLFSRSGQPNCDNCRRRRRSASSAELTLTLSHGGPRNDGRPEPAERNARQPLRVAPPLTTCWPVGFRLAPPPLPGCQWQLIDRAAGQTNAQTVGRTGANERLILYCQRSSSSRKERERVCSSSQARCELSGNILTASARIKGRTEREAARCRALVSRGISILFLICCH